MWWIKPRGEGFPHGKAWRLFAKKCECGVLILVFFPSLLSRASFGEMFVSCICHVLESEKFMWQR